MASRKRTQVDYTFNEFDEMVTEAMEDLIEGSSESKSEYNDPARPTGGLGVGKDINTIIQQQAEDRAARNGANGDGGDGEKKAPAKVRKIRPRLTDLSDEDDAGDVDDDEYQEEDAEEEGGQQGGCASPSPVLSVPLMAE